MFSVVSDYVITHIYRKQTWPTLTHAVLMFQLPKANILHQNQKPWRRLSIRMTITPPIDTRHVLTLMDLEYECNIDIYNNITFIEQTSANFCLSCPGCFFANIWMTSGVLNASLIAACMACNDSSCRCQCRTVNNAVEPWKSYFILTVELMFHILQDHIAKMCTFLFGW